ncbi:uncharacterized protein [Acropora muricata]|uniref:uncharacterized protein isoform X4 n=1 Tax=Acropora muricata TaxID=159855 RepID=UPI0034E55F1D
MQGSYFHHLFLLCIWLSVKAPQLGCDAVSISDQCLQNCSLAVNVSRSTAKPVESQETCYNECLKKNQAACNDLKDRNSFLQSSQVNIYLVERGPKSYYANISWKISSDTTRNWTQGYLVFYVVDTQTKSFNKCRGVLGMNTSFTGFNITNEYLTKRSELFVMVFSLSQESEDPGATSWQSIEFIQATRPSTTQRGIEFVQATRPSTTRRGTTVEETTRLSIARTSITVEETTRPSIAQTKVLPTPAIIAICLTVAFVVVAVVIWRRFFDKRTEGEDVALLDSGFKFDAFIIYSTTDETWVKKKLLSILEKKHNIKCCIHYRDFLPGVPFVENMARSVYNSRKTIAVVSKSFLSSNYCNHELNIALHRLVERGDNSVIVVKLDDVEDSDLPIELQFRSYIDFTKATDKKTWEYKLVNSFIGEKC